MGQITVRAADSVTALELIQRKLGDDALILQTVTVDGQVEITATNDPVPAVRHRVDLLLNDPEPREMAPAQVSKPSPPQKHVLADGKIASFRGLWERAKREGGAAAGTTAVQDGTPRAVLPPIPTDAAPDCGAFKTAHRIVLCGPIGAGKTQVGLQLAMMRAALLPTVRPVFFFCGPGSDGDGAVLAQKSHLLGMETHFATPPQIPAPGPDQIQVVVLSGRMTDAPEMARHLSGGPVTVSALVLPAGLTRSRLQRHARKWGGIAPGVILTAPADMPPEQTETQDVVSVGLVPLWHSDPAVLLNGLHPISTGAPAQPNPVEHVARPVLRRHHPQSEICI